MADIDVRGPVEPVTAGVDLTAFQAIAVVSGLAEKFDKDTAGHLYCCRGILTEDVASSGEARVQVHGPMENDLWTWTPNQPIYATNAGAISQTAPTSGIIQPIAVAETATRIFIDIKDPPTPDKSYVHNQSVASATWTIVHNLAKRPAVDAYDSTNRHVRGRVVHDSENQMTVYFNGAFSGSAYLN